jgi:putative restriction endonuclease
VSSCELLIRAIQRYRPDSHVALDTFIGCRVLSDPVFFDEAEWFPVPDDWAPNIVTGKVYSAETSHGANLLEQLQARTSQALLFKHGRRDFEGLGDAPQAGYGAPLVVAPRLGQGAFRLRIADVYGYKCAISDTKVLPALDSAHIVPFAMGGDHSIGNGIMLRKDIHAIFDEGFATIDAEGKFKVSPRVCTIFNNGHEYLRLDGKPISVPNLAAHRPSPEGLDWHRRNVFKLD